MIEACGRLDEPGRPHIYRTTETFLRCFGIDSLEQLPYVDLPRGKSEGEIIPLDIDVPTPNGDSEEDSIENSSETVDTSNETDTTKIDGDEVKNETNTYNDENDIIETVEEDDLLDPDEEDDDEY